MIVIDNISNISCFFLKPFLKMGLKLYYLKSSKTKKFCNKNLRPLTFKRKSQDGYDLINKWCIGDKEYIDFYVSKYLPVKSEIYLKKLFKGIKDIRRKIIIAFLADLNSNYHEIGSINIHFCINKRKDEKLFLIHTSFKSYLLETNASLFDFQIFHYYLPFDDLLKIFKLIFKSLNFNFIKKSLINIFLNKKNINKNQSHYFKNSKRIGLIIHDSFYYGNGLYKKDHYFSNDINSPLHPDNMDIYIHHDDKDKLLSKIKNFKKLKISIPIISLIRSTFCLLYSLKKTRNIYELYGLFFSILFYIKYSSWLKYFKNQKNSHVIYDYDVLISKSLSLALESLGVKTLAIQERPIISKMYTYGLIADTYLVTSNLYENLCKKNQAILVNKFFKFGMWRSSFFYRKDLVKINNTTFYSSNNSKINNFKYRIVVIGLYIDFENNMPDTNLEAFSDFINNTKIIANKFSDAAIIIRMKTLTEKEKNYIIHHISDSENIFLSTDYERYMISYSLCKDADLIISACCSLAEESLAFGKKVIFMNNLYPIRNMAYETYIEPFHFCIASSIDDAIKLVDLCLVNNSKLNDQYRNLQRLISGEIDLSKPNIISQTLEKLLD